MQHDKCPWRLAQLMTNTALLNRGYSWHGSTNGATFLDCINSTKEVVTMLTRFLFILSRTCLASFYLIWWKHSVNNDDYTAMRTFLVIVFCSDIHEKGSLKRQETMHMTTNRLNSPWLDKLYDLVVEHPAGGSSFCYLQKISQYQSHAVFT
jgi:hypothetical protein